MPWHVPVRQRNDHFIEDKRTPSLRGEVLEADTTGPTVAHRYNSTELGKFCLPPKRDLLAFRSAESTVSAAVVGVGHHVKAMGDSTAAGGAQVEGAGGIHPASWGSERGKAEPVAG